MTEKRKVIVVGAGLMGTGIAYTFASSGFEVALIDSNPQAAESAFKKIKVLLEEGVTRGKIDQQTVEEAQSRISIDEALNENHADAVLLVETASEVLEVKQSIMWQADNLLNASALLATNTSALSISEIASATSRADHVIGMHFFNPVHKMKLVELIRGVDTSDDTLMATKGLVEAIGKKSITVNEAPGFTTSRISALLGNEAMYMLAEGVASAEDIDTSLRMAFNHPMGPLELGDLTGWDTRLKVLQYLHQTLGEKFRPCPLIIKMVKAGRHGRKTGRGVYEYDVDGQRIADSGLKGAA